MVSVSLFGCSTRTHVGSPRNEPLSLKESPNTTTDEYPKPLPAFALAPHSARARALGLALAPAAERKKVRRRRAANIVVVVNIQQLVAALCTEGRRHHRSAQQDRKKEVKVKLPHLFVVPLMTSAQVARCCIRA